MARDDYFVIAYRILAYLYACLERNNSRIVRMQELGDVQGKQFWERFLT